MENSDAANTEIDLLKNALKEKLARRRALRSGEARLGFGGRIIDQPDTDGKRNVMTDGNTILGNVNMSTQNATVGNVLGNMGNMRKAVSEHTQCTSSYKTPEPVFILDDQQRSLMSKSAMKTKIRRMKKAANDNALLKKQRVARVKLKKKAQKLTKYKKETDNWDRILLNGVIYAVDELGLRLMPLLDPDSETAEIIEWNNWKYKRHPNGILNRVEKVKSVQHCRYFTRKGICNRSLHCSYVHDMNRVILCRQYVAGNCTKECIFNHERTEFNTPVCLYYLQGNCLKKNCLYLHRFPPHAQDKNYSVWTCRAFSVGGYCPRGSLCPFLHLYNCPDYEEVGQCPREKCQLTHIITKRLQELMQTSLDTDGVVVARDSDSVKIINSYTVPPATLFVRPSSFTVDVPEVPYEEDPDLVIHLESSDDDME